MLFQLVKTRVFSLDVGMGQVPLLGKPVSWQPWMQTGVLLLPQPNVQA